MLDINLLNKVNQQLDRVRAKHGDYASFKEVIGVLLEEFMELNEESRKHELDFDRIEEEIIDMLVVLFKAYSDIVLKKNRR